MIGIIFAMEEELSSFLKNKEIIETREIYELKFYKLNINFKEIIIVESGVGKVNSARTTQILIDNFKPNLIINIGVAGGLTDSINILDIVIGEKLVQHDFDITIFNHPKGYIPKIGEYVETNKDLVNKIYNLGISLNLNIHKGIIASGDKFITDINERKQINNDYNAICLEMEGASIAQVCKLCNTPFIVIRSISDSIEKNSHLDHEEFLEESCFIISKFLEEIIDTL